MSYQLSITELEHSEPQIVNINISPSKTKRTIQSVEFFQTHQVFDALCQNSEKHSQKKDSTQISAVVRTKDENNKEEVSVTKLILKRRASSVVPTLCVEKKFEDKRLHSHANFENPDANFCTLTLSTRNLDELPSPDKKKITLSPGKKFHIEIEESEAGQNYELFPVPEGEGTPEDKKEEALELEMINNSQAEEFASIQEEDGHNIPLIEADHVELDVQDQVLNEGSPDQTPNVGNAQAAVNNAQTDPNRIKEPEIRIHLAKENVFYLTMICISALLQLDMNLLTFELLLIPVYAYLIIVSLINLHWKIKVLDFIWLETDETFNSTDPLCIILSLTILNFKIIQFLPVSIFACIPMLVLNIAYIKNSKAFFLDKCIGILLRSYFTVQIILISLKLDGDITWGWVFVLLPTCGLLGVKIASVYNSVFILIIQLCTVGNITRLSKLIGFLWVLLNGIQHFVLLGLFLAGIETLHSMKNLEYLYLAGRVSLITFSVLFIYTNLFKKQLIKFIAVLDLVESHLARYAEDQNTGTRKRKISFEVEKKNSYFVMLSSTYFRPLQKGLTGNGNRKESVEKAKNMLSDLKIARNRSGHSGVSKEETREDSVLDIQMLRQYKENLDKKFLDLEKPSVFSPLRGNHKGKTMIEARKKREDIKELKDSSINGNLAASMGDLDEAQKINSNAAKRARDGNEDENLCYVCYANPPDAIMISCGHGGICYDCATAAVKVKDECLECRGKVEAIYRVDPNPKLFDIVKGVELKKIVTSDV